MEREVFITMVAVSPNAPEKEAMKLDALNHDLSAPTLDNKRAVAYEARGKRRLHATNSQGGTVATESEPTPDPVPAPSEPPNSL